MKILYFAWLRQKVGRSEEVLDIPASVATTGQLVACLRTRGPEFDALFQEGARVRIAVNQVHAGVDARVANGDEVAFFPPVTGG